MIGERKKYFAGMTREQLRALTFRDFLVEEIVEFRNNTPLSPEERDFAELFFIQGMKVSDVCKRMHVSRSTAYRIRSDLSARMKLTSERMLYREKGLTDGD